MPRRNGGRSRVAARETTITLTTNQIGPEARSPLLVPEGRLFFYPYRRRDRLIDRALTRRWRALVIENEYVRATVLPELGGRLFSLYDKVSRHEVFVSPRRFRFGRIHLRGAWAPVGVELNFPKGHSAASTVPVTCLLLREADGGASIVSGSVDRVTGMHWEVRFTLRPGIGRLLIHNRFSNPTPLPHGAMYWHNAAVWLSDGFRFQSRARMAYVLGQIGPFPWRNGRDYTWYRNRLWTDDLFLVGVPEDWFGYYNHDTDFGALHVADRRLIPGKKFFSWGASADGRMWSRTFDLAGRHYGELQAGLFETQSQKMRLEPGQAIECDEGWYPIAGLGDVLQANERVAVGLKPSPQGVRHPASKVPDPFPGKAPRLTLLVTEPVGPITLTCWDRATGHVLVEKRLRPEPLAARSLPLEASPGPKGVRIRLAGPDGVLLDRDVPPLRKPSTREIDRARQRIHPRHPRTARGLVAAATDAANWQQFSRTEALLKRALEKAPALAEAQCELGWLAMHNADLRDAERRFRAALEADPQDASAALGLGHVLSATGGTDEALRHYRTAGRRRASRASAAVAEAQLLAHVGHRDQAIRRLRHLIRIEPQQVDACLLLAALEWSVGEEAEAAVHLRQGVERGPTHPLSLAVPWLRAQRPRDRQRLWRRLRGACAGDAQVLIEAAVALEEIGLREAGLALLAAAREDRHFPRNAMLGYLAAHWLSKGVRNAKRLVPTQSGANPDVKVPDTLGNPAQWLDWAGRCAPGRIDPSRPAEVAALRWAQRQRRSDANVPLFLGNWHAARRHEASAVRAWRRAVALDPRCGIAHRNLGFTLFRHRRRLPEALEHYRAAIARYPDELDFYLEAARLLALMARTNDRVALLEGAPASVRKSDTWIKAYAVALQDAGRPADALAAISGPGPFPPVALEKGEALSASIPRCMGNWCEPVLPVGPDLIPWEGEYQMRHCWVECHLALGRRALAEDHLDRAEHHFKECLRYPPNLLIGEPYHTERSPGLYHLALAAEARGDRTGAAALHAQSADEQHRIRHGRGVVAAYYSALSARWLGRRAQARAMLRPLAEPRRHRQRRRPVTLDEWFGYDHYRHAFGIGLALKGLGRYDEARRALGMVKRVYGPQAEAMWHLRTLKRFGLEAVKMPIRARRKRRTERCQEREATGSRQGREP